MGNGPGTSHRTHIKRVVFARTQCQSPGQGNQQEKDRVKKYRNGQHKPTD